MAFSCPLGTEQDLDYDPNDDEEDYDMDCTSNVPPHNKNKSDHDDIMDDTHDNEHKCNCNHCHITNNHFTAVNWTVHKTQRPIDFCISSISSFPLLSIPIYSPHILSHLCV